MPRWLFPFLLMLAGCGNQPDFDERFRQQSDNLAAEANAIEAELGNQLAGANEAERAAGEGAVASADNRM